MNNTQTLMIHEVLGFFNMADYLLYPCKAM